MSIKQDQPGLSADDRAAIEALVAEHAWLIDHGQADRIAGLYTEDGRMLGVGPDLVGRDAIAAWSVKRAAMHERVSRHVCTNLRLMPVGESEARGTLILTVFRHDGASPRATTPFMVGDYEDIYRRGDDGTWRFAERRINTIFGGA